jgi:hypothetical protein
LSNRDCGEEDREGQGRKMTENNQWYWQLYWHKKGPHGGTFHRVEQAHFRLKLRIKQVDRPEGRRPSLGRVCRILCGNNKALSSVVDVKKGRFRGATIVSLNFAQGEALRYVR